MELVLLLYGVPTGIYGNFSCASNPHTRGFSPIAFETVTHVLFLQT